MTIDFLRPARAGPLVARGRVGKRGRSMAFPSAELFDGQGELVARAHGVWAIRRPG
jgi:acyl-coenzyme A thioesterase PaaI-like protein